MTREEEMVAAIYRLGNTLDDEQKKDFSLVINYIKYLVELYK